MKRNTPEVVLNFLNIHYIHAIKRYGDKSRGGREREKDREMERKRQGMLTPL